MSGNKADSSYVHLFLLGRIQTSLYISSENGSEMYVVVKCMHAQHVDTDWKYYFKKQKGCFFCEHATADSVGTFRFFPSCPAGEKFWFQIKKMFKYSYSLLFDLASDHSCCQPSMSTVVNRVRRSKTVVNNHRLLCCNTFGMMPKSNKRAIFFSMVIYSSSVYFYVSVLSLPVQLTHLWNDLLYVKWNIKPCSVTMFVLSVLVSVFLSLTNSVFKQTLLCYVPLMAWAVHLSSVVYNVVAPYAEGWTFRNIFCTT